MHQVLPLIKHEGRQTYGWRDMTSRLCVYLPGLVKKHWQMFTSRAISGNGYTAIYLRLVNNEIGNIKRRWLQSPGNTLIPLVKHQTFYCNHDGFGCTSGGHERLSIWRSDRKALIHGHTTHIVALREVPFCSYLEISLWKQLRFNICFNAADRDNSRHCTAIISIQAYYPPNRHSSMMLSLLPCDLTCSMWHSDIIFLHSEICNVLTQYKT